MHRRAVLAGGFAAFAAAASAAPTKAEAWIAYEARLRARLADAGGGRFDEAAARALLRLTNAARTRTGTAELAWSDDLAESARAHAADLAARSYVEHVSPDGFDPTDRLGLLARGMLATPAENIVYHRGGPQVGAEALMAQWRRSPPHWTNLLRPRHSHAGFGVVRKDDRAYGVGLYARPDGALAAPLPFYVESAAQVMRAVRGLPRPFIGFWLDDQLGGRGRVGLASGGGHPGAGPGVYRLRLDRQMGERSFQSLYGPIFVWRGG
jgi:uncharacterized protein YkwD